MAGNKLRGPDSPDLRSLRWRSDWRIDAQLGPWDLRLDGAAGELSVAVQELLVPSGKLT